MKYYRAFVLLNNLFVNLNMTLKRFQVAVMERLTGIVSDCELSVPSKEIAIAVIHDIFDEEEFEIIGEIKEIPCIVQIDIPPYCPN